MTLADDLRAAAVPSCATGIAALTMGTATRLFLAWKAAYKPHAKRHEDGRPWHLHPLLRPAPAARTDAPAPPLAWRSWEQQRRQVPWTAIFVTLRVGVVSRLPCPQHPGRR